MKEIQSRLQSTIEEYNEKLFNKQTELDNTKSELKCREKYMEMLTEENERLKETRDSTRNKIMQFSKKIFFVETEIKNNMMSLEDRLNSLEKYSNAQHSSSMEISERLTHYLSFIEELKTKIQRLERDKSNLVGEYENLKLTSKTSFGELEHKTNL
ncbi:hypothetical protein MXB_4450 [Myxobolus squamalis]|nr:hypothetical protein MXB_4450 [Myxobolus squamalis]